MTQDDKDESPEEGHTVCIPKEIVDRYDIENVDGDDVFWTSDDHDEAAFLPPEDI